MNVRARIIVEGKVQGVGYRLAVREAAKKLGIRGFIKNLEDGNVEIIAEASKEAVEMFIKAISIKAPPIEVTDAKTEYSEPTGEFAIFKIVYGKMEDELFEGFGTGVSYLLTVRDELKDAINGVGKKVDVVGQKVDNLGESLGNKIDVVGQKMEDVGKKVDVVGQKVDAMHTDMNTRFDRTDVKYDKIHGALIDVVKEMREERKN